MGRCRLTMLSRKEREAIHAASLRILEETGAVVRSADARRFLRAAGAKVLEKDMRVLFPEGLLQETLQAAQEAVLPMLWGGEPFEVWLKEGGRIPWPWPARKSNGSWGTTSPCRCRRTSRGSWMRSPAA